MQQRPRDVPADVGASGDATEYPGYLVIRTGRPRTDPWEAGDVVEVIPLGEPEPTPDAITWRLHTVVPDLVPNQGRVRKSGSCNT